MNNMIKETEPKLSWMDKKRAEIIKQCDQLFDDMVNHYDIIFDGDTTREFTIESGTWRVSTINDEIYEKYGSEIQKELILWIDNERVQGSLFNKSNWRPFYYYDLFINYMGYNKFFIYKNYYFQLEINYINQHPLSFYLMLYGWKDPDNEKLQPDNCAVLTSDNIIPTYYWNNNVITL